MRQSVIFVFLCLFVVGCKSTSTLTPIIYTTTEVTVEPKRVEKLIDSNLQMHILFVAELNIDLGIKKTLVLIGVKLVNMAK